MDTRLQFLALSKVPFGQAPTVPIVTPKKGPARPKPFLIWLWLGPIGPAIGMRIVGLAQVSVLPSAAGASCILRAFLRSSARVRLIASLRGQAVSPARPI